MNTRQIWQAALGEIQLQMPRANYDTWLKDTFIVSHEDGVFVIAAPTPFAREWLANRLAGHVKRTLTGILGRSVDVRFVVQTPRQSPGAIAPARAGGQTGVTQSSVALRFVSPPPDPQTNLNPRYTFDNFIVGSSNRFAHAAAQAIARGLTADYNPLFLYSGVGLGKTHLLHAIGNLAMKQDGLSVLYVSSETFTNEMIMSIREQQTATFRAKYRSVDLLMIDDIQFLAGKEGTQEEFFHTFNTLHQLGKQIVVSSDRPPRAIMSMEDRLRSRLEWGLIADIQPPDLETRIAILSAKAESHNANVPPDVLDIIARKTPCNIRELEGALNRVLAFAAMGSLSLTSETAERALADIMSRPQKVRPQAVLQAVANYYSVPLTSLTGKGRDKDVVVPRHVAMFLMREETDCSLSLIGAELGGRDHSTVLHGSNKIAGDVETDNTLRQQIMELRDILHSPAKVPIAAAK
jgi:chromosomal replication initiator protein